MSIDSTSSYNPFSQPGNDPVKDKNKTSFFKGIEIRIKNIFTRISSGDDLSKKGKEFANKILAYDKNSPTTLKEDLGANIRWLKGKDITALANYLNNQANTEQKERIKDVFANAYNNARNIETRAVLSEGLI